MRQFLEPAGEVEKVQFDLRVFDRPSQFHQPDRGLAVITGARSIPAHCAVPIPNREHSCQAIRAILWQRSRVARRTTRLALSWPALKAIVEKIKYPGVSLAHLG